jgi:hypothetical protein
VAVETGLEEWDAGGEIALPAGGWGAASGAEVGARLPEGSLRRGLRQGARGAAARRELGARPPEGSSRHGLRHGARGAAAGDCGADDIGGSRAEEHGRAEISGIFFGLGLVGFAMKSGPYREPVVDSYSTTGFSIDGPYIYIYMETILSSMTE